MHSHCHRSIRHPCAGMALRLTALRCIKLNVDPTAAHHIDVRRRGEPSRKRKEAILSFFVSFFFSESSSCIGSNVCTPKKEGTSCSKHLHNNSNNRKNIRIIKYKMRLQYSTSPSCNSSTSFIDFYNNSNIVTSVLLLLLLFCYIPSSSQQ